MSAAAKIEEKRGRGRPKNDPDELILIDQGPQAIFDYLMKKYKNKEIAERMTPAKKSIYNLVSKGELSRYGRRGCLLLDKNELIERYCK